MNILYLSDFHYDELFGGAEYNDKEIVKYLIKEKHNVEYLTCNKISIKKLQEYKYKNFNLIISNFVTLSEESCDFITKNLNYIIYEHDHKYCFGRNPANYKNFLIPKNKIVNYDFYKNAKKIFCQTSFHQEIIKKNLEIDNLYNISGNFWSDEDLDYISSLSNSMKKTNLGSVLESNTGGKNTIGAIEYCKKNNIEYKLISDSNYSNFLKKICENNKIIFLPTVPETLSRIIVEAKMMNVNVITNKLVGARYEEWFLLSGKDIINYMKLLRKRVIDEIQKSF